MGVSLPREKKFIRCKWIFTIKGSNGQLERNKRRLVVQGYTQTYGNDYEETFVLVAKLNSIFEFCLLWQKNKWFVWNYHLQFEGDKEHGTVCKLKSLYGLKQSSQAWFAYFSNALRQLSYKQGQVDHILFVKQAYDGMKSSLMAYVDDIVITRDNILEIDNLKKCVQTEIQVKDFGKTSVLSWCQE